MTASILLVMGFPSNLQHSKIVFFGVSRGCLCCRQHKIIHRVKDVEMVKQLAVIGAGRIGQVHANAISKVREAILVAISDPMENAAIAVRDEYGCDIRSIEQIEQSDDVDAVVICTPTDTHAELI